MRSCRNGLIKQPECAITVVVWVGWLFVSRQAAHIPLGIVGAVMVVGQGAAVLGSEMPSSANEG